MGVLELVDKFHLGWNDFYHASSSLVTHILRVIYLTMFFKALVSLILNKFREYSLFSFYFYN